ncbi:MAG: 30S ribosomal protein S4e [Candidatus Aenigmatarchaeota archaeon]
MKRLASPKFWKIGRRNKKFVITPRPGPHKKEKSIPLGIIIRDYLKCAETLEEAKKVMNKIRVNGKIRKDYRFPVGLMDIIEAANLYYRIVPSKNYLELKEVNDGNIKLSKIVNKTYLKGNRVQINLHDGGNFVVKKEEDKFKTGDVIAFDLLNKEKKVLKFDKGSVVLITEGSNVGRIGRVEEIKITKSTKPNIVVLSVENKKIEVPKDYCFVIGEKEPLIEV